MSTVQRSHRNFHFVSGESSQFHISACEEFQLCIPFSSEPMRIRRQQGERVEESVIPPRSEYTLAPGDSAILSWSGPAEVLVVNFAAGVLAEAARSLGFTSEFSLRSAKTSDPMIHSIASMVRDIFANQKKASKSLVDGSTALLAVRLLSNAVKSDPRREQLSPTSLKRVVNFVESHLMEEFNLEDMAHAAGCSRFHFARAFRRCMGMSPWRYVTQCRLRRAQLLLRGQENFSVAEVCHMAGFQDQSHFTRAFKSAFSTTPGSFRRQAAAAV